MGPRLDSRGNSLVVDVAQNASLASMGPRLDSRGNTLTPSTNLTVAFWLQWGRDLIVAETSPNASLDVPSSTASMGPRLDSRGNRSLLAASVNAAPLQWGRDLIVAETWPRQIEASSWCRASMGPRLDSRGNPLRS